MSSEKTTQASTETATVGCNTSHDEIHVDDIGFVKRKMQSMISSAATTNIGQFFIRKIDRILWIIENTAKWSVPQNIGISFDLLNFKFILNV